MLRPWLLLAYMVAALHADPAAGAPQDGKPTPPRMLEEGGVVLREKRDWWLFGKPKDFGGPLQRGME